MTVPSTWIGIAGLMAGLTACQPAPAQSAARDTEPRKPAHARVAFAHTLPPLDGKRLEVKVVEVTYAPGGSSPPHSHPCPVIVYVLEGAVRMQVKGEAESVYRAGESFYEAPNGVHAVSANYSATEPARFVAYFVCDHETPLGVAVPDTRPARGVTP